MSFVREDLAFSRPRHSHLRSHPRLLDQQFALALAEKDVLSVVGPLLSEEYCRPWRNLAATSRDLGSYIINDKDKFEFSVDMQEFAEDEVFVKIADGYINVEGKHCEKQDEHGYVTRLFMRKYPMPESCSADTVVSKLSSDGLLTVTAPKKTPEALRGERNVPITKTGPVRKEPKGKGRGAERKV